MTPMTLHELQALAALAGADLTPAEISTETGLSVRTVRRALWNLAYASMISIQSTGRYTMTRSGRTVYTAKRRLLV
ncbi:hypothetical protein [Nocardia sp. alder85J]|uniref:hypothetical protein n=1 Tax=Nocardia sp. alder85J TaxID=2862949 RepID=UPI001CD21982|nr:hypothetical protein [Nocardia sp. alder85J]MCX4099254.1 hypothetical protein [Nocardia sp. alder85J]